MAGRKRSQIVFEAKETSRKTSRSIGVGSPLLGGGGSESASYDKRNASASPPMRGSEPASYDKQNVSAAPPMGGGVVSPKSY